MSPLALILVRVIVAHPITKMTKYETTCHPDRWPSVLPTTAASRFMSFPHDYADAVSLASPCVALLQLSVGAMHWADDKVLIGGALHEYSRSDVARMLMV